MLCGRRASALDKTKTSSTVVIDVEDSETVDSDSDRRKELDRTVAAVVIPSSLLEPTLPPPAQVIVSFLLYNVMVQNSCQLFNLIILASCIDINIIHYHYSVYTKTRVF